MSAQIENMLRNPAYGEPKIADVIRNNYCTSCGTCEAVCPVGVVMVEREEIDVTADPRNYRKANLHTEDYLKSLKLSFNDIRHLTCMNCFGCERVCPALDGFAENEFDNILYMKAARSSTFKGQDGAAVSHIAASLLEGGQIDCVIGVTRDDIWHTDICIMTKTHQVTKSSGTKYTYHPVVSYLRYLVGNHHFMPGPPLLHENTIQALQGFRNIALVGTPCQVHGARLLQRDQQVNIALIIGLICMESFSYEIMSRVIIPRKTEFDLKDITRMNIHKGKFIVSTVDRKKELPIAEIMPYARNGCHHCIDYTSYFSDITVGSVGSDDGFSTIIVRTAAGDNFLKQVQGLEFSDKPINMNIIKKLADQKHTSNQWDWKAFMKRKWLDECQPQRYWGSTPTVWGKEKLKSRGIVFE